MSTTASVSNSRSALDDTIQSRTPRGRFQAPPNAVARTPDQMYEYLQRLDRPCYVVRDRHGEVGLTTRGSITEGGSLELLQTLNPLPPSQLGAAGFRSKYGTELSYVAGGMANGISGERLVTAMGKTGLLSTFGAAGLSESRLESAIRKIQSELPRKPYAFNLVHTPQSEDLEQKIVDLYLKHDVRTIEASAFMNLTPSIVRYRVSGLETTRDGSVRVQNRILAKLSHRHVAKQFLSPPPPEMVQHLVEEGAVTRKQAQLARHVPMADDLTAEGDSGGHTDNRSLTSLLPDLLNLRDRIQEEQNYGAPVGVGAAGGIGTPAAAASAFALGADYVLTGSINQACVEANASDHTKQLLSEAGTSDVTMAPAADMFEMGVQVQVLDHGTLFAPRAQKLYELYESYEGIHDLPSDVRREIESDIFRRSLDEVWNDCVSFFQDRDPGKLQRARENPKRKMALVFRWYLGRSSNWSNEGVEGREADYQAWCGPAMGAFNAWAEGTRFESPSNRRVAVVAQELMRGAAYRTRLSILRSAGFRLPISIRSYRPIRQPQRR